MEWLNHVMAWFSVHPACLFILLFGISFGKSTVLISSALPPASVMLLAVIFTSQEALSSWWIWLAIATGAAVGSMVNYSLGMVMAHQRLLARFLLRYQDAMLRYHLRLQRNGDWLLFISRFIAVLRYVVPLLAGVLRLNPAKVCLVSLISAGVWAALYVAGISAIAPVFLPALSES